MRLSICNLTRMELQHFLTSTKYKTKCKKPLRSSSKSLQLKGFKVFHKGLKSAYKLRKRYAKAGEAMEQTKVEPYLRERAWDIYKSHSTETQGCFQEAV